MEVCEVMFYSRGRTDRTNGFLTTAILVIVGLFYSFAGAASAQSGALSGDLSRLSDQEIGQRYDFIKQRLDEGQLNSQIWQYGFTSGWGVGVVIGVTQASLASDKVTMTSGIVTSVKAAGGVARLLLSPNPGRHGSEDLQMLPAASSADRLRRLASAEALLSEVEDRAIDRTNWKRHAGNVAVNLVGASVILGVGGGSNDSVESALVSAGVGIVAGEIMAFTMPSRGIKDVKDYRRNFSGRPSEPEMSWRISPAGMGLALNVTF